MATREISINDFGLLIAYVLPGFAALWGTSYLAPEVRSWFGQAPAEVPTLGGFLYLTVASIAAGLTIRNLWINNFPISSCGRDSPVVETRQNIVEEDPHRFLEAFDDFPARFVDLVDNVRND